jgi:glycosyltransferase involved in cell wall biosynthesis
MAAAMTQAIVDLNLESLVWVAGDRHDVPKLLQSMEMFVLPSLGEGILNTQLEAMATGLPLIATRVGGNPELMEDGLNGRLVSVRDDMALTEAITELATLAERPEKLGRNALNTLRASFDWRRTLADYLSMHDQLTGGEFASAGQEDIPNA